MNPELIDRYFKALQSEFSSIVRGDFAAGQRDLETSVATIGTFASGQREYELMYEVY